MNHTDAYVDILVTSLRKKVLLLEKIENVITEQERELKKTSPDIDHLDEIEKQIGELLQEVEQAEDGFESVYNRVKDSMEIIKRSTSLKFRKCRAISKKLQIKRLR